MLRQLGGQDEIAECAGMICLNCKQDMIVVEYHDVELDYCTNCEGVWFDAGELELLLQSVDPAGPEQAVKDMLRLPEVKPSHGHRKCPICNQHMKEVATGEPVTHVDVCRQGDGLWFDGGELHQILRQMVQTPSATGAIPQPIATFLGEVFEGKE